MPHVAILQQRIQQHRAERRTERHRQARLHAVAQPAIHHLDERQIRLRDRFVEPILLQKMLVLRMPDKGQMRVENQRQVALHDQSPKSKVPPLKATLQTRTTLGFGLWPLDSFLPLLTSHFPPKVSSTSDPAGAALPRLDTESRA